MDDALKQRLVGATILVVLAVIFLPFVLDGSGMVKPTEPLSINLPDSSSENTVTITLKPKNKALASSSKPQLASKPVVEVKAVEPVSEKKAVSETDTSPTPRIEPKLTPKPTPSKVNSSQPTAAITITSGQWIVQLGSFSQRGNAQALRDQLINKGYQSFVEASGQGSRKVFRVRVGPITSREAAETIRKKLKLNEKRDALVMAYP